MDKATIAYNNYIEQGLEKDYVLFYNFTKNWLRKNLRKYSILMENDVFEDIYHDILLKMLKNKEIIDLKKGSVLSYIYTSVVNKTRDLHKHSVIKEAYKKRVIANDI